MKLDNRTHWRTTDLRRIMVRVAREELNDTPRQRAQRAKLRVDVGYTRGEGHRGNSMNGCAWLRGDSATLRLPRRGPVDPVEFAWLCAHEFSHTRGMQHARMPGWLMRFTAASRARYAWAADGYDIRQTPPAVRPSAEAIAQGKHAHALMLLARATTRRKRAVTLEATWRRKVRYYETRMAAGRTKASTPGGEGGHDDGN